MDHPYIAAVIGGARRSLGAPGELAVRMGFYVAILVVFTALWEAAIAANNGEIESYDLRAMIWYTVAAEGAVIATKPRMIEEIGDDIGSGAIAVEMLRPVSVVAFRIAAELGEALVRLTSALIVGGVMISITVGPPPGVRGALLALPATPAAFITGLPTSLIDDFRLSTAASLVGAALVFCTLGASLFALGLRRYSSGSLWTRA